MKNRSLNPDSSCMHLTEIYQSINAIVPKHATYSKQHIFELSLMQDKTQDWHFKDIELRKELTELRVLCTIMAPGNI